MTWDTCSHMFMCVFTADMSWQIPIIMTKKSVPLCHWHCLYCTKCFLPSCVCQVASSGKAVMGSTVGSVAIFVLHHRGCVCLTSLERCHQVPPPAAQHCSSFPPTQPCAGSLVVPPQVSHVIRRKKWNIGYKGEKFWKRFFGLSLKSFLGHQNYFNLLLEA